MQAAQPRRSLSVREFRNFGAGIFACSNSGRGNPNLAVDIGTGFPMSMVSRDPANPKPDPDGIRLCNLQSAEAIRSPRKTGGCGKRSEPTSMVGANETTASSPSRMPATSVSRRYAGDGIPGPFFPNMPECREEDRCFGAPLSGGRKDTGNPATESRIGNVPDICRSPDRLTIWGMLPASNIPYGIESSFVQENDIRLPRVVRTSFASKGAEECGMARESRRQAVDRDVFRANTGNTRNGRWMPKRFGQAGVIASPGHRNAGRSMRRGRRISRPPERSGEFINRENESGTNSSCRRFRDATFGYFATFSGRDRATRLRICDLSRYRILCGNKADVGDWFEMPCRAGGRLWDWRKSARG